MDVKMRAAGLCLAILALAAIAVPPVEAAPKKKPVVYTTRPDPPINRPRARVTVAPRSFLDAGTEVLPGDRKFTDYAFPVGTFSTPLSVWQNTGGRVGCHPPPLPAPSHLPPPLNPS